MTGDTFSGTDLPLEDDFVFYAPGCAWENTATIIAPSPTVPTGAIVVVEGQGNNASARGFDKVYTAPLMTADGQLARQPAKQHTLPVPVTRTVGSDHSSVRLTDNSILVMKDGFVWDDFGAMGPSWRDFASVTGGGPDWAVVSAAKDAPAHYPPWQSGQDGHLNAQLDVDTIRGERWGTTAFHSVNGTDWSVVGTIDLGKVDGGTYAVPRPWGWVPNTDPQTRQSKPGKYHPDCAAYAPYQAKDPAGNWLWWIGGGDHSWTYACPFTGTVYITFGWTSGGGAQPARSGMLLFRSTDRGRTWTELPYPGNGSPWEPAVMTTDASGCLYVLQTRDGQLPLLSWTKGSGVDAKDASDFNSAHVYYTDGAHKSVPAWTQPSPATGTAADPNVTGELMTHIASVPSIARSLDGDRILIAYHAKGETHGNQVVLVVECIVSESLQSMTNVVEVTASEPLTRAVCFPNFIQADDSPHLLLHYIEVPLATAKSQCLSLVWEFDLHGPAGGGIPVSLSGGAARAFDPPASPCAGMGDYQCGDVARIGDQLIYAIQWAEADGVHLNYFVHSFAKPKPPLPPPPVGFTTCGQLKTWLDAARNSGQLDDTYDALLATYQDQCPLGTSPSHRVVLS